MRTFSQQPRRGMIGVASHTAAPTAKWKAVEKKHAVGMRPIYSHIAYLKAGWTADIPSIPAISPYLRHGCMAGYPYRMPTASPCGLGLPLCQELEKL